MSDQPLPDIGPSKVASPPFDDPSADIILRTPDLIEFSVQSPILSYASPIFSSMLTLPQPENGPKAQRPVIDVSEDSQALDRLLRLCYPIIKPKLSRLEEIVPVLKAALKYEMEWPVLLLSTDLRAMIPSNPLKVWAAACRAGLEDVAREAASEIRKRVPPAEPARAWGMPPPPPPDALSILAQLLEEDPLLDNLQDISAGDYYRLRESLRTFADKPQSMSFLFLSPSPSSPVGQQSCPYISPPPQRSVAHLPDGFVPRISSPDVLLQCRDSAGVQHRAHRVLLALHSAVLDEQCTRARATSSHIDFDGNSSGSAELPVLQLDVASDTLVTLLTVCYDGPGGLPSSLAALAVMLIAARDLQMSQIHSLVAAQWEDVAKKSPLEAYFVAVQYGLQDRARAAARNAVEKPLAGWYVPCMEESSALTYHRLLVYYDACVDAVQKQLELGIAEWNTLTQDAPSHSRYDDYTFDQTASRRWMQTYLRDLKLLAAEQGPGRGGDVTVFGFLEQIGRQSGIFWPSVASKECHTLAKGLVEFGTPLPKAIADAIAQVELEL